MNNVFIQKHQTNANRCEICHKMDKFNPVNNTCLRCNSIIVVNKQIATKTYNCMSFTGAILFVMSLISFIFREKDYDYYHLAAAGLAFLGITTIILSIEPIKNSTAEAKILTKKSFRIAHSKIQKMGLLLNRLFYYLTYGFLGLIYIGTLGLPFFTTEFFSSLLLGGLLVITCCLLCEGFAMVNTRVLKILPGEVYHTIKN